MRDPLAQHGYTTLGPIARGAFATVTKAVVKSTGEEVAVKSFLKKRKSTATPGEMALGMTRTAEDDVVKGTRELEMLRLLAAQASLHPGVAHLLEVVESAVPCTRCSSTAGRIASFLLSCALLRPGGGPGRRALRAGVPRIRQPSLPPVCSWLIRDAHGRAGQQRSGAPARRGGGAPRRQAGQHSSSTAGMRGTHGVCTACGMCISPEPLPLLPSPLTRGR